MAVYTFFPCQSDGPALCFETLELDGDASALAQAGDLLARHKTATFVTVWNGDRMVCSVPRNDPPIERPDVIPAPWGSPGAGSLN